MRRRLTLWFVLGVVVMTVAGLSATYAVLQRQMLADLDAELSQQLSDFSRMAASATTPTALYDLTRQYLAGAESEALAQRGIILSLRLTDGSVVSNSSTLKLEELNASQPLISSGERILTSVDSPAGPYRVAGTPVVQGQERVGAVEVAASLQTTRSTLRRALILFGAAGTVGIVVVSLGFWFLVGRALSPVRRISRTAAAITREDLTRRIGHKGPRDEIGELAETMDAMLDRLQLAFEAQERFISDVSHELRTPLTIMKGHLQVLDRGKDLDPEQVGQEHALVLDEIDRLNRLVGDLLLIARSTRVDFLRKETVPLDEFIRTLVEQGIIKTKHEAKYCIQHCEFGYTTNTPLDVALASNFMMATHYDGKPLEPDHGYPLRGVMGAIPGKRQDSDRYLWKGGKWLRGLEFVAQDEPGFWEQAGYSMSAGIWNEERYARRGW